MAFIHLLSFILLLTATTVFSQRARSTAAPISDDDYDDEPAPKVQTNPCPVNGSGYYKDPEQCDKYWECNVRYGKIEAILCEDGFVFTGEHRNVQKCDYPFTVDCTDRPKLQTPLSRPHCPRKNGLFPEPEDCGVYWQCVRGQAMEQTCQGALAFNPKTGLCQWPHQVPGCEDLRPKVVKPVVATPEPENDDEQDETDTPKPPSENSRRPTSRPQQQRNRPTPKPVQTEKPATAAPVTPRPPSRVVTSRRQFSIQPPRGTTTSTTTTTTAKPAEGEEYYYDDEGGN